MKKVLLLFVLAAAIAGISTATAGARPDIGARPHRAQTCTYYFPEVQAQAPGYIRAWGGWSGCSGTKQVCLSAYFYGTWQDQICTATHTELTGGANTAYINCSSGFTYAAVMKTSGIGNIWSSNYLCP
jgi:hypothetical protein